MEKIDELLQELHSLRQLLSKLLASQQLAALYQQQAAMHQFWQSLALGCVSFALAIIIGGKTPWTDLFAWFRSRWDSLVTMLWNLIDRITGVNTATV